MINIILKVIKNNGVLQNIKAMEESKLANKAYTLNIDQEIRTLDDQDIKQFLRFEQQKIKYSKQQSSQIQVNQSNVISDDQYKKIDEHIKSLRHLANFFLEKYYNDRSINNIIICEWAFIKDQELDKIIIQNISKRPKFSFAFPFTDDKINSQVQINSCDTRFFAQNGHLYWLAGIEKYNHEIYIRTYKTTFIGDWFTELTLQKMLNYLKEKLDILEYKRQIEVKKHVHLTCHDIMFKTKNEELELINMFVNPDFLKFVETFRDCKIFVGRFINKNFGFDISHYESTDNIIIENFGTDDFTIFVSFSKTNKDAKILLTINNRSTISSLSKDGVDLDLLQSINQEIIKNNLVVLQNLGHILEADYPVKTFKNTNWTTMKISIEKMIKETNAIGNNHELIDLCKILTKDQKTVDKVCDGLFIVVIARNKDMFVSFNNLITRDYAIHAIVPKKLDVPTELEDIKVFVSMERMFAIEEISQCLVIFRKESMQSLYDPQTIQNNRDILSKYGYITNKDNLPKLTEINFKQLTQTVFTSQKKTFEYITENERNSKYNKEQLQQQKQQHQLILQQQQQKFLQQQKNGQEQLQQQQQKFLQQQKNHQEQLQQQQQQLQLTLQLIPNNNQQQQLQQLQLAIKQQKELIQKLEQTPQQQLEQLLQQPTTVQPATTTSNNNQPATTTVQPTNNQQQQLQQQQLEIKRQQKDNKKDSKDFKKNIVINELATLLKNNDNNDKQIKNNQQQEQSFKQQPTTNNINIIQNQQTTTVQTSITNQQQQQQQNEKQQQENKDINIQKTLEQESNEFKSKKEENNNSIQTNSINNNGKVKVEDKTIISEQQQQKILNSQEQQQHYEIINQNQQQNLITGASNSNEYLNKKISSNQENNKTLLEIANQQQQQQLLSKYNESKEEINTQFLDNNNNKNSHMLNNNNYKNQDQLKELSKSYQEQQQPLLKTHKYKKQKQNEASNNKIFIYVGVFLLVVVICTIVYYIQKIYYN